MSTKVNIEPDENMNAGGAPVITTVTLILPAAASSTAFQAFKVLNRTARRRLFIVEGDTNIANYCTVDLTVWDSSVSSPTDESHFRTTGNGTVSIGNVDSGYPAIAGSGDAGSLANPGDTLLLSLANGTTANTNPGVITVTIIESFN